MVVRAAEYGLSSAAGLAWSVRRLRRRLSGQGSAAESAAAPERTGGRGRGAASDRGVAAGRGVARLYRRLVAAAAVAALVGYSAAQDVDRMAGDAPAGSLLATVAGSGVLLGVYILSAKALRVTEVDVLTRHVRKRIATLAGH
ncbi:MAG: hypothetical protein JF587_16435 [Catenulisporales bacterium]|nr:hypothetical protein [Catenulisporales bacterium]